MSCDVESSPRTRDTASAARRHHTSLDPATQSALVTDYATHLDNLATD